MSVPRETLNEHRNRLYQGALYLVDNPGEPLPGATATKAEIRGFEDRAIALHLAKHTYYSQKVRGATFEPVDADGMRRQVGYLYTRGATPSTKDKKPSDQNAVDRVFYTGTGELKTDFLESYNYDKATFSEADLPAHRENEEEEDEVDVISDSLKQNSKDAEASEDTGKGQGEHSNKIKLKPKVAVDNKVLKQDNTDRTGRLPELGFTSAENDDVQVQGAGAGNSSSGSVDPSAEPKGKGEALDSSAESTKRHRDTDDDGAPTERSPKASRLSHVATTTTPAEHPLPAIETPHAAPDAPKITTPPEDAASASNSHIEPPIRLDTSALTTELGKLKQRTSDDTYDVLDCIALQLSQYPAALDPDPPQRLLSLYVRCWGKDWEQLRSKCTRDWALPAPQVLMSLVSAFLYDNVLDQDASLLDDLERLRRTASLDGSSETIRNFLQPKQCWSDLKASAHTVHTNQAYALLSQGKADIKARLKDEADKIATTLWDIIVPHFRAISGFARGYGISSGRPEEDWMEMFKERIPALIERCLDHRLRLRGTGCEFTYTWPKTGEEYDHRTMLIDHNGAEIPGTRQTVVWTVFPGLEVIAPDETREKLYIRAVVKIRQTTK
jgi:hypothetical protein